MGATPNFNEPILGNTPSTTAPGPADDVSFNRGVGSSATTQPGSTAQGTADSAKQMLDTGVHKAQDAMHQLQGKVNELTTRLVDSIDIDEMTHKLEQQVRDHPALTLVIAAGAGYVLGRSLRR